MKATLQIGNNSFYDELAEINRFSGIGDEILNLWNEEKGTLISIDYLKDEWDERTTESLFSNLEILVPPLETNIFQIFLFSTIEPEKYGKVQPTICDDYDYKIDAKVDENKNVKLTVYRNELNFGDLKRIGFFEKTKLKQENYSLQSFEKGSFEIDTNLESLIAGFKDVDINNNLNKIGAFSSN